MAGQGFDPDFIFTWPTGRMGVMEGDSAVMALFSAELEKLEREGRRPTRRCASKMERVRAKYDSELDANFAAARGFVDAIITPEQTRDALGACPADCVQQPGAASWHPGFSLIDRDRITAFLKCTLKMEDAK